jgi:hypothetical protein
MPSSSLDDPNASVASMQDGGFGHFPSDDELTELALAADPADAIPADAIPIDLHLALFGSPLPSWYMPPAITRVGRHWRTPVVLAIVAAFVLIDAMGLCNTYGLLQIA